MSKDVISFARLSLSSQQAFVNEITSGRRVKDGSRGSHGETENEMSKASRGTRWIEESAPHSTTVWGSGVHGEAPAENHLVYNVTVSERLIIELYTVSDCKVRGVCVNSPKSSLDKTLHASTR